MNKTSYLANIGEVVTEDERIIFSVSLTLKRNNKFSIKKTVSISAIDSFHKYYGYFQGNILRGNSL